MLLFLAPDFLRISWCLHTWDNVTTVDFGNEPTSSWPGMFSGIRPILVPRICPEDTNLFGIFIRRSGEFAGSQFGPTSAAM
jgi:hypothetical protein